MSTFFSHFYHSNTGIVYQCMQCKSFYLQPFGKMKKQQDSAVSFAVANGPPLDQNCPQCGQSSCQVLYSLIPFGDWVKGGRSYMVGKIT